MPMLRCLIVAIAVHIEDICLQLRRAGKKNHFARTFTTILDQDAEPVSGVGVTGSWSGLTIQPVSGVSNSNGIVTLDSSKVRTNLSGAGS